MLQWALGGVAQLALGLASSIKYTRIVRGIELDALPPNHDPKKNCYNGTFIFEKKKKNQALINRYLSYLTNKFSERILHLLFVTLSHLACIFIINVIKIINIYILILKCSK